MAAVGGVGAAMLIDGKPLHLVGHQSAAVLCRGAVGENGRSFHDLYDGRINVVRMDIFVQYAA